MNSIFEINDCPHCMNDPCSCFEDRLKLRSMPPWLDERDAEYADPLSAYEGYSFSFSGRICCSECSAQRKIIPVKIYEPDNRFVICPFGHLQLHPGYEDDATWIDIDGIWHFKNGKRYNLKNGNYLESLLPVWEILEKHKEINNVTD